MSSLSAAIHLSGTFIRIGLEILITDWSTEVFATIICLIFVLLFILFRRWRVTKNGAIEAPRDELQMSAWQDEMERRCQQTISMTQMITDRTQRLMRLVEQTRQQWRSRRLKTKIYCNQLNQIYQQIATDPAVVSSDVNIDGRTDEQKTRSERTRDILRDWKSSMSSAVLTSKLCKYICGDDDEINSFKTAGGLPALDCHDADEGRNAALIQRLKHMCATFESFLEDEDVDDGQPIDENEELKNTTVSDNDSSSPAIDLRSETVMSSFSSDIISSSVRPRLTDVTKEEDLNTRHVVAEKLAACRKDYVVVLAQYRLVIDSFERIMRRTDVLSAVVDAERMRYAKTFQEVRSSSEDVVDKASGSSFTATSINSKNRVTNTITGNTGGKTRITDTMAGNTVELFRELDIMFDRYDSALTGTREAAEKLRNLSEDVARKTARLSDVCDRLDSFERQWTRAVKQFADDAGVTFDMSTNSTRRRWIELSSLSIDEHEQNVVNKMQVMKQLTAEKKRILRTILLPWKRVYDKDVEMLNVSECKESVEDVDWEKNLEDELIQFDGKEALRTEKMSERSRTMDNEATSRIVAFCQRVYCRNKAITDDLENEFHQRFTLLQSFTVDDQKAGLSDRILTTPTGRKINSTLRSPKMNQHWSRKNTSSPQTYSSMAYSQTIDRIRQTTEINSRSNELFLWYQSALEKRAAAHARLVQELATRRERFNVAWTSKDQLLPGFFAEAVMQDEEEWEQRGEEEERFNLLSPAQFFMDIETKVSCASAIFETLTQVRTRCAEIVAEVRAQSLTARSVSTACRRDSYKILDAWCHSQRQESLRCWQAELDGMEIERGRQLPQLLGDDENIKSRGTVPRINPKVCSLEEYKRNIAENRQLLNDITTRDAAQFQRLRDRLTDIYADNQIDQLVNIITEGRFVNEWIPYRDAKHIIIQTIDEVITTKLNDVAVNFSQLNPYSRQPIVLKDDRRMDGVITAGNWTADYRCDICEELLQKELCDLFWRKSRDVLDRFAQARRSAEEFSITLVDIQQAFEMSSSVVDDIRTADAVEREELEQTLRATSGKFQTKLLFCSDMLDALEADYEQCRRRQDEVHDLSSKIRDLHERCVDLARCALAAGDEIQDVNSRLEENNQQTLESQTTMSSAKLNTYSCWSLDEYERSLLRGHKDRIRAVIRDVTDGDGRIARGIIVSPARPGGDSAGQEEGGGDEFIHHPSTVVCLEEFGRIVDESANKVNDAISLHRQQCARFEDACERHGLRRAEECKQHEEQYNDCQPLEEQDMEKHGLTPNDILQRRANWQSEIHDLVKKLESIDETNCCHLISISTHKSHGIKQSELSGSRDYQISEKVKSRTIIAAANNAVNQILKRASENCIDAAGALQMRVRDAKESVKRANALFEENQQIFEVFIENKKTLTEQQLARGKRLLQSSGHDEENEGEMCAERRELNDLTENLERCREMLRNRAERLVELKRRRDVQHESKKKKQEEAIQRILEATNSYERLGLAQPASKYSYNSYTKADISKAFRAQSKLVHPDKCVLVGADEASRLLSEAKIELLERYKYR